MGFYKKMVNMCRKPEGFWGKMMLNGMNSGHAKAADWGIENFPRIRPKRILEIGCGGGRNAARLLEVYPSAHLTGIDYAQASVDKSLDYNKKQIGAGRCIIQRGDVSDLEFDQETFSLITAFETVYFWPDLLHCFQEVYRVAEPEGYFAVICETDGVDPRGLRYERMIEGMKVYTPEAIRNTMKQAGFSRTTIRRHESKPWILVVGQK